MEGPTSAPSRREAAVDDGGDPDSGSRDRMVRASFGLVGESVNDA